MKRKLCSWLNIFILEVQNLKYKEFCSHSHCLSFSGKLQNIATRSNGNMVSAVTPTTDGENTVRLEACVETHTCDQTKTVWNLYQLCVRIVCSVCTLPSAPYLLDDSSPGYETITILLAFFLVYNPVRIQLHSSILIWTSPAVNLFCFIEVLARLERVLVGATILTATSTIPCGVHPWPFMT